MDLSTWLDWLPLIIAVVLVLERGMYYMGGRGKRNLDIARVAQEVAKDTVADCKSDLDKLKIEIETLQEQRATDRAIIEALQERVRVLEWENARLRAENKKLRESGEVKVNLTGKSG